MPVIVRQMRGTSALLNRRNSMVAVLAGIAAAFSLTIAADPRLSKEVGERVNQAAHGFETVAAMLAERSPGQRPAGALANLKHKRSAVESNAAPLGRHVIPPLEAIMGAPSAPLIVPPTVAAPQLYNVVAGTPAPIVPASSGAGGSPPILSDIPPPGGGGGVIAPPPIITEELPPPPVTTSAVPEPASWAMMLIGFAAISSAFRRHERHRGQLAIG